MLQLQAHRKVGKYTQINVFHLGEVWGLVICICHDTGMYHYFGYFLGVLPDFWVSFWIVPGFFEYNFFVKFFCLGMTPVFGY